MNASAPRRCWPPRCKKCTMPWPRGWWTGEEGAIDAPIALAHGSIIQRCVCGRGQPGRARNTGCWPGAEGTHCCGWCPSRGAHIRSVCISPVPGASAGGRRHVRRMSGAHGAPGAALRRGIVWPAGGGCGAHSARAAARRHACAAGGVRHPGGRFSAFDPFPCVDTNVKKGMRRRAGKGLNLHRGQNSV